MKKITLFIIVAIFISISLISKEIIFEYEVNQPSIRNLDNGYQQVYFKNSLNSAKIGEPSLPYLPVKILLPPGEIAEKVKFVKSNRVLIKGEYNVIPYQGVTPYNKKRNFIKKESVYQTDNKFPEKYNKIFTTQFLNGYSILLSSYTPLEYYPQSKKLYFYKKIKVIISTKKDKRAQNALRNLSSRKEIIKKIVNFVDNAGLRNLYPSKKLRTTYDILLITSEEYSNDFDNYVLLYEKRGFKTKIKTVEEIENEINGQDLPEKIRNYIIQEYQSSGINFVTLAGDVEIVPYRGFYCEVQSTEIYTDDNIPADLYYSALDGNWNDNGNSYWAEPGEDDLLPEISVGRLSFSNINELNSILHKLTMYLDNPVEGELQKPLLVGEHLWDDPITWGGDYLDLLISHHEDNGYITDGIPLTDNITKLYDRDLGYEWNVSQMLQKINEGHSFIHHCGHSNFNYNLRMGISEITDNNFNLVNGIDHNYTLLYSHGCIAGAFDYDDCIAERMVDINNFALAYIGNSRYGWFNEGSTEGPSEHLHREFVNALYGENIGNLGTAHMQSKIASSWWVTAPGQHEEGAMRWCFYDCNVLGDPVVYVWTKEPIDIQVDYPDNVVLGTEQITINLSSSTGETEGLRCSILKNNQLLTYAIADENGIATIDVSQINELGQATLMVSGYNCKIHTYDITFTAPAGAYPYIEDYSIISGDDNTIEFGERAFPILVIKNGGNQSVQNYNIKLYCDDQYITVSDSIFSSNSVILPNEQVTIQNDNLNFDISSNIPNDYEFQINAQIIYNDSLISNNLLNFIAYNAYVQLTDIIIDNQNNEILPGNTETLKIIIKNIGGADLHNVLLSLSADNNQITVQNSETNLNDLNSQESYELDYIISASSEVEIGTIVDFSLNITADNQYEQNEHFSLTIGRITEGFESGDFSLFEWQFSGNQNWEISSENPHNGEFCAKSGEIGNNQSSTIFISYTVGQHSNISFYKKVSSEQSYDFLKFYIDDNLMGEWSGNVNWSISTYPVQPGQHIFKWVYVKDQYVSDGEDCAWIDDIVFPIPSTSSQEITQINNSKLNFIAYPNPMNLIFTKNGNITIEYLLPKKENVEISIYNIKGQLVKRVNFYNKIKGKYNWDLKNSYGKKISSGIYLYKLKSDSFKKIKKITILR